MNRLNFLPHLNDKLVIISVKRMFGDYFDLFGLFSQLGLNIQFDENDKYKIYAYCAVIHKGAVRYQCLSEEPISYTDEVGSVQIMVNSRPKFKGDISNIIINQAEYSPNIRGVNIVVFDTNKLECDLALNYDGALHKNRLRVIKGNSFMDSFNRKNWAVITGILRSLYDFYKILWALIDLRNQGILQGIVLSTWEGAIDDELRNKLIQADIFIVETPEMEMIANYTNMSALRQMLLLSQGLNAVPEDCFVLRVRTDMSSSFVNLFLPCLEADYDLTPATLGVFPNLFKYKIVVLNAVFARPLFFRDFVFYGYKNDIKKLVGCISFDTKSFNLSAESIIFGTLFFNIYPLLNELHMKINMRNRLINFLNTYFQQPQDYLPDCLIKCYALSASITYTHYHLVHKASKEDADFCIEDFFLLNKGGKINADLDIKSNELFERLVFAKARKSKIYDRFLNYIDDIKNGRNLYNGLSMKDCEDIESFFCGASYMHIGRSAVPKNSYVNQEEYFRLFFMEEKELMSLMNLSSQDMRRYIMTKDIDSPFYLELLAGLIMEYNIDAAIVLSGLLFDKRIVKEQLSVDVYDRYKNICFFWVSKLGDQTVTITTLKAIWAYLRYSEVGDFGLAKRAFNQVIALLKDWKKPIENKKYSEMFIDFLKLRLEDCKLIAQNEIKIIAFLREIGQITDEKADELKKLMVQDNV